MHHFQHLLKLLTNDSELNRLSNESTYINAFHVAMATEEYMDALCFADQMLQFQQDNRLNDSFNPVWLMYLQVILNGGITTKLFDLSLLHLKLEVAIIQLRKSGNSLFIVEAILLKFK